jgi:hypothetical protein
MKTIENVGSFEIVRYKFEYLDLQPKIIIEMVKVLDTQGKYIKFASLKEVIEFLPLYPVKFKKI